MLVLGSRYSRQLTRKQYACGECARVDIELLIDILIIRDVIVPDI